MDFYIISNGEESIYNPFSGKCSRGNWLDSYTSVPFFNVNFEQYTTAIEMKNTTTSEGLKLFFDYLYLVEQGKLPA